MLTGHQIRTTLQRNPGTVADPGSSSSTSPAPPASRSSNCRTTPVRDIGFVIVAEIGSSPAAEPERGCSLPSQRRTDHSTVNSSLPTVHNSIAGRERPDGPRRLKAVGDSTLIEPTHAHTRPGLRCDCRPSTLLPQPAQHPHDTRDDGDRDDEHDGDHNHSTDGHHHRSNNPEPVRQRVPAEAERVDSDGRDG